MKKETKMTTNEQLIALAEHKCHECRHGHAYGGGGECLLFSSIIKRTIKPELDIGCENEFCDGCYLINDAQDYCPVFNKTLEYDEYFFKLKRPQECIASEVK
jgi:hypothetical protein